MFYPDYQRVATSEAKQRFEKLWDTALDPSPGSPWSRSSTPRARARSAACTSWARTRGCRIRCQPCAAGLAALDHLVVQDIFLTETAYLADVVLPATAWPEKIGTVTNTDRLCSWAGNRGAAGRGKA